jgi:hypothetical protein
MQDGNERESWHVYKGKKNGGRILLSLVLVSGILANLGCVLKLGITFGPKRPLDLGEHEAG